MGGFNASGRVISVFTLKEKGKKYVGDRELKDVVISDKAIHVVKIGSRLLETVVKLILLLSRAFSCLQEELRKIERQRLNVFMAACVSC